MLVLILAYLGGVLTILSPCILPVLPFVFARSDRPFMRNGLPMLLGMAITFAAVATLAALGGGWAVHANQYGRIIEVMGTIVQGGFTKAALLSEPPAGLPGNQVPTVPAPAPAGAPTPGGAPKVPSGQGG